MGRLSETDLYPPVKSFLEALGYEVKGEVGAADVVAISFGGGDMFPVRMTRILFQTCDAAILYLGGSNRDDEVSQLERWLTQWQLVEQPFLVLVGGHDHGGSLADHVAQLHCVVTDVLTRGANRLVRPGWVRLFSLDQRAQALVWLLATVRESERQD